MRAAGGSRTCFCRSSRSRKCGLAEAARMKRPGEVMVTSTLRLRGSSVRPERNAVESKDERLRSGRTGRFGTVVVGITVMAMLCPGATSAQDFPTKPITIFLVLAPGTGLDVVARAYGEKLAQSLG